MSDAGGAQLEAAIRGANDAGRAAIIGFTTGGFPDRARFPGILRELSHVVDVLEVGIPFSDPMADGVTIQRSSEAALRDGTTLSWILDTLQASAPECPIVFMSYLNPVLQLGFEHFADRAREAGVAGLIVPDLPFEECRPLRSVLDDREIALVQLVTPVTPVERAAPLCAESRGFVYAVTMTGITGASVSDRDGIADYLSRLRGLSPLPIAAGFGIRSPDDVRRVAPHANAVIVGSAVVEAIDRGEDPRDLLGALRDAAAEVGLAFA